MSEKAKRIEYKIHHKCYPKTDVFSKGVKNQTEVQEQNFHFTSVLNPDLFEEEMKNRSKCKLLRSVSPDSTYGHIS